MKKTKFIALALLAAFGMSAHAQGGIVSSESENVYRIKTKKPKKFMLYVKAGVGYDAINYDDNIDGQKETKSDGAFGYEVDFGIRKSIGTNSIYWGAEVGAMSSIDQHEYYPYGGDRTVENKKVLSIFFSPLIGYDIKAGESTTFSPYVGPSIGLIDFGDGIAGLSVGTNLWFNQKYAIGVNYKYNYNFSDHENPQYHKFALTGIIKF
ncbi:MAG: hypothetical protein J5720_00715 [Bacteroidaceae bacterium]|nr:hypothetical protein [Bacteroidaceae bacterium]